MGEHNFLDEINQLTEESKPHSTDSILRCICNADFRALQKRWFSQKPSESPDMLQADYAKEVADYTLAAIKLYKEAISHKKISYIELHFFQDASFNGIQPQIDIQFDTGLRHIDIGMFWDDGIGLDREGKKNCQTMAETVWYEYKAENSQDTLFPLVDMVKEMVKKMYPEVDVNCTIA